ncbi:spermidine synthase [Paenibacillus sp. CAA11]|uniref:spermidine synthase n=1 Tax=Paenibacillus sp. CAA11 TaxID=1532905 RepID=UPI000D3B7137|nr:fused MFS/spermidine synthase [Paenibacillus sp. CAA11]AWB46358.1 spermidine synthase [Paenibacillus sp. CAA11]
MKLLYQAATDHHDIAVYDAEEFDGRKGNFRLLEFSGEAVQGALDLKDPQRVLFEYPRAMMHLMEHNLPGFEAVFMIGHGVGTLPGQYPEQQFKVAELDPQVVELSREYFGYRHQNVLVGDGRELLAREPAGSYDYLILDAFTSSGTPQHLVTKPFFEMAKERLDSRGAILINIMGRGKQDQLVLAVHTTLSETYPYIKAFALPQGSAGERQNILLMGSSSPLRYQARRMAGFHEVDLGPGHTLWDRRS